MSQALTNDGSGVISRTVPLSEESLHFDESNCIEPFLVKETATWITENRFRQIGLQFPDELLHISSFICQRLSTLTKQFCFVLGDSSFAGCCVDEVAGTRFQLDALVHYGRACLSKLSGTVPVLFIFGFYPIQRGLHTGLLTSLADQLLSNVSRKSQLSEPIPLLITYDFRYQDWARAFADALIARQSEAEVSAFTLVWSEPDLTPPAVSLRSLNSHLTAFSDPVLHRCGRSFYLPQSQNADVLRRYPWSLVYLSCGTDDHHSDQPSEAFTLYRILLALPEVAYDQTFWLQTANRTLNPVHDQMKRLLRRRSYLIEKAKDACRIGILMGTLSVQGYQSAIKRIQTLLQQAGRFYITLVVGRLNEAKLANLPELDLFVLIACPESSLLDSRNMLIPVVTPFELECALASLSGGPENQLTRSWTEQKWWVDFRDLLPGGACYCLESDVVPSNRSNQDVDADVSLITGKLRVLSQPDVNSLNSDGGEGSLVPRGDWAVVAPDVMSSRYARTWFGLDPALGQHPVSQLRRGRSGVPTHYDSERKD